MINIVYVWSLKT